jgi:hypothetical protein
VRFSQEIEEMIREEFVAVASPYYSLATEDLMELDTYIKKNLLKHKIGETDLSIDLNTIKEKIGLRLPLGTATFQYTVKIRTGATLRYGIHSISKFIKRVIKKSSDSREIQIKALSDSLEIIKSEFRNAVRFHFDNLRENLKFQYFARLLDALEDHIYRLLIERYESYSTDIRSIENMLQKQGTERDELMRFLKHSSEKINAIVDEINIVQQSSSATAQ